MNIEKDTVVTIRYQVSNAQGKVLDEPKEPMAYLHGGYGNTLAPIEAALNGQAKGYETTLTLQPEDAFGVRDDTLLQTIPKSSFPPGVKLGGTLKGVDDEGKEQIFTVMKIKGDTVYLDGNHPWAGMVLKFKLKVTDVRAAIAEEIAHGHAHGAHGHHH